MPNKKIIIKDEDVIAATENEFVADLDIKTMKLTYTKDFYIVMHKLLKNGKTAIEAYEALGFDTKKLGVDRAYAAAQRAKKLGAKKNYTIDPSSYDGSVSREMMGELTAEEELAYQQARIIYLEKFIEFQKKLPSLLEEIYTSSKKN